MEQSRTTDQLIVFARARLPLMLLLAAHLPFVVVYYAGLWKNQTHYQFFPFALGAFAVLFWQRRSEVTGDWSKPALALIALDILSMVVGGWISSPWLFALGFCCSLLALCMITGDHGFQRRLSYLSLLPLLTIRLPLNGDLTVIHSLQSVTTTVASKSLQRFGFLHAREGNVLDFPGKRFLVEEACSGVQSLFTILFVAALIICVKRRTLAHGVALLCSGVVFAGLMNVVRVISIAVAWDRRNVDLSTGWQHDAIGYGCLALAAILLLSADSFLLFITEMVPDVRRPGAVGAFRNPLITVWNYLFTVAPITQSSSSAKLATAAATPTHAPGPRFVFVAAGAVLCATMLTVQAYSFLGSPPQQANAQAPLQSDMTEADLPESLEGYSRDGYAAETRDPGNAAGAFSNIWTYGRDGNKVRISCDLPFSGWHRLHDAYTSQEWSVESVELRPGAEDWSAVVARLAHVSGSRFAVSIYSLCDRNGLPVRPRGVGTTGDRVLERVLGTTQNDQTDSAIYACQAFSELTTAFDDQQVRDLVALHFASRELIRKRMSPTSPR